MSREIMADCQEEANEILGAYVQRGKGEERIWPVFTTDVITIAVALYQERMRHAVVPVVSHAELEPPTHWPSTTTWGGVDWSHEGPG